MTISAKHSILDVCQGSEYVSGLLSCFAVVLRRIHGNVDISETDYSIHSNLIIQVIMIKGTLMQI